MKIIFNSLKKKAEKVSNIRCYSMINNFAAGLKILATRLKIVFPHRAREFIRPIYNHFINFLDERQHPKITALHAKVFKIPDLRFRLSFFQAAQIYLRVNRISGSYFEFGCHEANTFRIALNTIGKHGQPNKISTFWAFDSFEGMPEPVGIDKQKIWRGAMNTTSEMAFKRLIYKDAYRIKIVKGFFKDSLPRTVIPPEQYPALIYIDCDFYSSTRDVLSWIGSYLRHGCLLAFDDWDCYFGDNSRGQRKAFYEFKSTLGDGFEFIEFMKIDSGGMAFICLEKNKAGTDFIGY